MKNNKRKEEKGIFPFLKTPPTSLKPRQEGITLVDDRCLPTAQLEEILKIDADLIDFAKVVDHAGMLTRYSPSWMKHRLRLYRKYHIRTLPSGISFEISCIQKKTMEFFDQIKELGFTCVEISEDVIPPIPPRERDGFVKYAQKIGLEVYTEVGRKFPEEKLDVAETVRQIEWDLGLGVKKVTIEKSEIALSIEKRWGAIEEIMERVGIQNIFLEVGPEGYPHLHQWAIEKFGPKVNLGNVELDHILKVEAMRLGLDRRVRYKFLSDFILPGQGWGKVQFPPSKRKGG